MQVQIEKHFAVILGCLALCFSSACLDENQNNGSSIQPVVVQHLGGQGRSLAATNDRVIAALGENGFKIVSATHSQSPLEVHHHALQGRTNLVTMAAGSAVVFNDASGIHLFDVRDAVEPREAASLSLEAFQDYVRDMALFESEGSLTLNLLSEVEGLSAYQLDSTMSLGHKVDFGLPPFPRPTKVIPRADDVMILSMAEGLYRYQVTGEQLTHPVKYDRPNMLRDVACRDQVCAVAAMEHGLHVVEFGEEEVRVLQVLTFAEAVARVFADGTFVHAAFALTDERYALVTFRWTDTGLHLIQRIDTHSQPVGVVRVDEMIWVLLQSGSLQVYKLEEEGA